MATKKEQREQLRQERLAAAQAAQSADRRRLYLGYAVAGLLVAAVLAGLVVLVIGGGDENGGGGGGETAGNCDSENAHVQELIGAVPEGAVCDAREGTPPPAVQEAVLEPAVKAANGELQLDLEEEGNTHFDDDSKGSYESEPPTSGDHYGVGTETGSGALADGAYLETPPISRVVHALEHGRVAIFYSPDLSEEEQLELKGVFDEDPAGVILVPYADMPYEVAASAWRNLVRFDEYEGATTLDALRAFRDVLRGQGPENFPLVVSG